MLRQDLKKVEVVEPLRGIAAVAVMWFHFTNASNLFRDATGVGAWIRASGAGGWLGVEVFFVISGFILPYSMYCRGYRLRHLATFVTKRVVRLDPPYLLNVLLCLAVWWAASQVPDFRGDRFEFEPSRALLHLGYLNALVGQGWYNPVYWTLAIEFQYYLLLAAVFPLIAHRNTLVHVPFVLVLAVVALPFPQDRFVVHWLGLFALGMATFQFHCGLTTRNVYLGLVVAVGGLAAARLGWVVASVGIATSLVIAFARPRRIAPLAFLGTVSYSLYLIHVPVGQRFINLGARIADSNLARSLVLAVSVVITIWLSHLLYLWIERPAQKWSAALRYRQ